MPSESKQQNDQNEDEPLPDLEKLAKQWHQRLKDPVMQQLVKTGKMKLSPLVVKLLEMYPEQKSKSNPR